MKAAEGTSLGASSSERMAGRGRSTQRIMSTVVNKVLVKVKPSKKSTSPDKDAEDAERWAMSSYLRSVLRHLPLYEHPPTWRIWVWQFLSGGPHSAVLAFVCANGSFLKGVLDSPDLNSRCQCFMDVATTLGPVFYQVTFSKNRNNTRRMLERLIELSEELEADANEEQAASLRATVATMRRVNRFLVGALTVVLSMMLLTPVLERKLTMPVYPHPEGVFWFMACITQEFVMVTIGLCVGNIMCTLMLVSFGISGLAENLTLRLKESHGERSMIRLSRLHRDILAVAECMPATYYITLFCLITGYLTVSLLGTYNVAAGSFIPYTVFIVPGSLSFYFNIAVISDKLFTSTGGINEASWGMDWTEEAPPTRRLVQLMMMRAQRPSSVVVPILGAVTLSAFMDSMRQWYSFLQMIRSLND